MGVSSSASALARKFTFEEVEYELRPLTFAQMARISTWLEDRARAAIYRAQASGASPQFVKGMQAALVEGIAAGRYEAGGAVFRDAASGGAFTRYVLQLMLEPHPQAEELSYRIEADPAKSGEVQALCESINSDPLAIRLRMIPTE